ncbi:MAG: glycosyltransferase family 8 protein [Prevotella sp.]|nr:glycosyltransferase family 8 protein [Prevotella sp.]MBQ3700007.1 glycosyltransferase family 8 protein [Prevotella sp.]
MDIVACTDKWFVMPTGVMMQSVCVNNPEVDIVFHIIVDDNVTEKGMRDLEETVTVFEGKSITFYHVDVTKFPCFPNVKMGSHVTQAAYYRLMLSEILPKSIHKVLYLDGDIIVRHSLLPLWNIDMKERPVGVVVYPYEVFPDLYDRLNIPSQLGYFNSGVMLIDLQYWRKHEVVKDFVRILQEYAEKLRFWDQDVLNVAFSENKVILPMKYNMTSGFLKKGKNPLWNNCKYKKDVEEARRDPVIVHYTDKKPWDAYHRHPDHPFRSTFYHYQDQTRWMGMKTDRRPFKIRVINFVADLLRKHGLKSPLPPSYDYIDIAPID